MCEFIVFKCSLLISSYFFLLDSRSCPSTAPSGVKENRAGRAEDFDRQMGSVPSFLRRSRAFPDECSRKPAWRRCRWWRWGWHFSWWIIWPFRLSCLAQRSNDNEFIFFYFTLMILFGIISSGQGQANKTLVVKQCLYYFCFSCKICCTKLTGLL